MITLDSVLPLSSSTLRLTRLAFGATPDRVAPALKVRGVHSGKPLAVGSLVAMRSVAGSVGRASGDDAGDVGAVADDVGQRIAGHARDRGMVKSWCSSLTASADSVA